MNSRRIDVARFRRNTRVFLPRLQMMAIAALTAGAGFLASVALAGIGLSSMWLRYPLCVVIAYLVFVLLIWVWCRTRDWLDADLPDIGDGGSSGSSWSGGGGCSGGGGASASFGDSAASSSNATDTALDAAGSADEAWPVLLGIALLVGTGLAIAWIIWIAPVMLGELAIDAALSTGLYRSMKRANADAWLRTTLRHTWLPFVLALICAWVAGAGLAWLAPEASTLGEIFNRR